MATARKKFQELLRKLFQFDNAELDFGIYRIINHKRAVIERFIEKDLIQGLDKELKRGAHAEQAELARQLEETASKIRETFGADALDAEGNLLKGQDLQLGKDYLALRARAGGAKSNPELEAEIFNHLYAFFSRYYDDGDFMSLRRYSRRDKYAIPYNGEEVHLHWANADQYYIKTGENFTDYSYKHGGWTVRFKLRNADVEQNNIKGAKRFFVPRADDIDFDAQARTLSIAFEYRPLNADEEMRYGKGGKDGGAENGNGKPKAKKKGQEGILADAQSAIQQAVKKEPDALAALLHEKRKDSEGNPVSLLDHHLRAYTRANTTDFFIHKDLKGFLERELDFYLKNEVLNLDELEAGGEARSDNWFQTLRAIKAIGRQIIAFVAQIENFQKRLFEKKKFVTEVNYCVTLDRVPEELYPEIANNKAQTAQWRDFFSIHEVSGDLASDGFKEPLSIAFLRAHRDLVLDTCNFPPSFRDALLASPSFLAKAGTVDTAINGLLVHGENFQALNLLRRQYRGEVKCIYIDPPYNTGSDEFVYKDNYQHASWLAMAADRIRLAAAFLSDAGVFFTSIDDGELPRLRMLLDGLFGSGNKLGTVVWKGATDNNPTRIAIEHEFILSFAKNAAMLPPVWESSTDEIKNLMLSKYESLKRSHKMPEKIQAAFREWIRENKESLRPLTHYDRVDKGGPYTGSRKVHNPGKEGYRYDVLHPNTGKPCREPARGYRYPEATMQKLLAEERILFGEDHTQIIQIKEYLKDYAGSFKGLVELDSRTGANALEALFGSRELFKNPKPVELISHLLEFTVGRGELICDFVAGSGTTGHALIDLNRRDGGQRRYLLIEVGDHFDVILKPRMQKVIYSAAWKDGRPLSPKATSHAFKYLRIESYEDALDNITFGASESQGALQLEDYVLSYMLDFETKSSDTLLNVAKLDAPFEYKLRRHGKDEPLAVDLPETFNYLIGLHVATRRVYENKGVRYLVYRGKAEGKETAVIWRTTRGWEKAEFEADREFVAKQKLTEGAEDAFVNSDSFIEGARSLDPVFKQRMFSDE